MPRKKLDLPKVTAESAALSSAREVVAAELLRRKRLPRALEALEASLFPVQRAFVEDTAKRVVAWSGRRSGKTFGLGARIIRAAQAFPGETIPVFERTQTCEAARVLWKTLQDLDASFQLQASFHHSRLICTLPNKAEICIIGADTLEAADKARGGRYPAAFIDEAQSFRAHVLKYIVDDVLGPALLDFGGSLTVVGTPGPRRQGAFFEMCHAEDGKWAHHHWCFLDNEALPLGSEYADWTPAARLAWRNTELEAELARRKVTKETPSVQREWFGNWVEDGDSLVYRLQSYNYLDPLTGADYRTPELDARWRYMIGLDVGWNDPCAFVVVGWRSDSPDIWVLESFEHQYLLPDAIAGHLERLRARYPRAGIVMDTGGHGGKIVEQLMLQRYGLPVTPAKKRGKFEHIAFLNSDMVSGRLRIVRWANQDLISDLATLRVAPPNKDGEVPEAEHPADDNHLPDGLLYAVTAVTGLRRGLPEFDGPTKGSREWEAARERALLEFDLKRHRARGTDGSTLGAAIALLG